MFTLGGTPDTPDPRDYVRATAAAPVPEIFSLQQHGIRVPWNQGSVASCTGFSTTAALENLFGRLHPDRNWQPSPLYLYYKARQLGGNVDADNGAQLRNVMRTLSDSGVPPLFAHPTLTDWRAPPTPEADRLASLLKIRDYQRILIGPTAPQEIRRFLHQEQLPVVATIQVYDTIYSSSVAYDGNINLPTPTSKSIGYHAIMCDAYDDTTQRFSGWNSWGRWGWGGRFSLPYEWFTRFELVSDIWTFSPVYW